MAKIKSLSFKHLPNAAHYGYCVHVSEQLSAAGATVLAALGDLPAQFNAWLDKESALMEWVRKSVLTAQIAGADRRVGKALVALNAQVRALQRSITPGVADAAHAVCLMLKNYGKVYIKPYDAQSGGVEAIIEQLIVAYAAEVAQLNLGVYVAELQDAAAEFRQLMVQRGAQWQQKPAENFKAVRRGIEADYHRIAARVNAGAELNLSPDFAAFINKLNPVIEYLNAEFHRVRHKLASADIAQIPPQPYTGAPVTPAPEVYYTTPKGAIEKLMLGKDYNLTYKNNRRPGNAACTVHGKGAYYGRKTVTFFVEGEFTNEAKNKYNDGKTKQRETKEDIPR
jgi:hypothetical protein